MIIVYNFFIFYSIIIVIISSQIQTILCCLIEKHNNNKKIIKVFSLNIISWVFYLFVLLLLILDANLIFIIKFLTFFMLTNQYAVGFIHLLCIISSFLHLCILILLPLLS